MPNLVLKYGVHNSVNLAATDFCFWIQITSVAPEPHCRVEMELRLCLVDVKVAMWE